jgi:hypothetical protein
MKRVEKQDERATGCRAAPLRRFPAACTIISRNYLSFARVLASSYLQHHPGARFYLLVVDKLPQGVAAGAGIHVIDPEELNLSYWSELCFKYDVTEFCTAVKPTLLSLLLNRYNEQEVIYFDPDILVMRPLEKLMEYLTWTNIVLTPHLLDPIPLDGLKPSDQDILIAGAYNLGFVAIKKSEATLAFLQWWEARLRDGCFVDVPHGLMTDQRWIDLVPGFFPATVLKDPTYNVAYWNIHSRALANDGGFRVNERPLTFFHFSGFDPANPRVFSRHQDRTNIVKGTALSDLLDLYVDLQMENGFEDCRNWPYGYGLFDNGVSLNTPLRRLWVALPAAKREGFGDPFCATRENSFLEWATRGDSEASGLSPFLKAAYKLRLTLWLSTRISKEGIGRAFCGGRTPTEPRR